MGVGALPPIGLTFSHYIHAETQQVKLQPLKDEVEDFNNELENRLVELKPKVI